MRAALLTRLRAFFDERGFVEVDTPLLADEVIPELHIEPLAVDGRWLQASPELAMKRLLAAGMPAIYQISRSFRGGEQGRLHNPEFAIAEWYRAGDGVDAGMDLLAELVTTLVANELRTACHVARTTYAAAFEQYAQVDPHRTTPSELAAAARRHSIPIPAEFPGDDRDEWLNLLLAAVVEPQLGTAGPEILFEYPATQAALATTRVTAEGVEIAERFELYWQGVELANGYHELTDAAALRRRFLQVNRQRWADGRRELPLPEKFLAAHEAGLPPCSGCALGFDRLAMLACGVTSIAEVMTFAWDE